MSQRPLFFVYCVIFWCWMVCILHLRIIRGISKYLMLRQIFFIRNVLGVQGCILAFSDITVLWSLGTNLHQPIKVFGRCYNEAFLFFVGWFVWALYTSSSYIFSTCYILLLNKNNRCLPMPLVIFASFWNPIKIHEAKQKTRTAPGKLFRLYEPIILL